MLWLKRQFLLLTSTLAGCLFFMTSASAIVQQPIYDTSSGALTGSQMLAKQNFVVPPESVNTSTITSITVRATFDKVCGMVLKLTNSALSTVNSQNVTTTAGVEQNYTFTWTSNPNFHTGNLAAFQYDGGNSIGGCTLTADRSGQIYGSVNTSSYPNGYWGGVSTTLKNEFFIINGTTTQSTIEFHAFPTSTCDFYVWDTDDYIAPSDTATYGGNIGPAVLWGSDPFGASFLDSQGCAIGSNFVLGTASSTCTASQGGVRKSAPLVPGYVYTATPLLLAPLDDARINFEPFDTLPEYTIAEGTSWQFIISGQPNVNGCSAISTIYPNFTWPFATTTFDNPYGGDWCAEMPETTTVQEIKKAGCQAAQYLFRPSEDSINNFYSLKGDIEHKPPFGYFSVYKTALDGFENTTSTTSTLAGVADSASLQLDTWANLSILQTLRTIFEWILYLLTGFYFYHRFKKLEF